uniref:Uncharacterized protein n=1 Tax=Aegilops tauschii subsp. strangulata TaxID=200361 RepID=A0A453GUA4_AEGTS
LISCFSHEIYNSLEQNIISNFTLPSKRLILIFKLYQTVLAHVCDLIILLTCMIFISIKTALGFFLTRPCLTMCLVLGLRYALIFPVHYDVNLPSFSSCVDAA